MATHAMTAPASLISKINSIATDADKAAAQSLNKTATYAIERAVSAIIETHNLQPGYVKKKFKVVGRASPNNLRVVISANERGTLLTRYPYRKTNGGFSVNVKKAGAAQFIKGAFELRGLRGSGATGIALNLKNAVEFFKLSVNKGKPSALKDAKLANMISDLASKKRGVVVLHSSSVNQMFEAQIDEIKEQSESFLVADFYDQLKRIRAK